MTATPDTLQFTPVYDPLEARIDIAVQQGIINGTMRAARRSGAWSGSEYAPARQPGSQVTTPSEDMLLDADTPGQLLSLEDGWQDASPAEDRRPATEAERAAAIALAKQGIARVRAARTTLGKNNITERYNPTARRDSRTRLSRQHLGRSR